MAKKNLPQRIHADDGPGIILLVFAEGSERDCAQSWLEEVGYEVLIEDSAEGAVELIGRRLDLDVAIVENAFCNAEPSVVNAVRSGPQGLELILAGQADVFVVTQGIAAGAVSFLPHPLTQSDLLSQVMVARHVARQAQLRESHRLSLPREVHFEGIVGTSPAMVEVMNILRKASPTDAPVVILGETGTGKELIARAIHESSLRRKGPFVALHLLATPEGLVESELFGHKKGAFTGALADRTGKLELADGGTLFLDELGDIPLETQAKLLRVLETRQFEQVGANRTIGSDFRLIAATNQDIEAMIQEKTFREELWQRIKVVRIDLPALRERRGDIPLLVQRFLKEASARYRREVDGIEREALNALSRYHWRGGNIRFLRNIIDQMVVLAEGATLTLRDVPREIRGPEVGDSASPAGAALAGRSMEEIEREAIRQTLEMTGGNRKAAADLLQIGERTLYRKIEKFKL